MPNTEERNYYSRWLVQVGRQARDDIPELIVGLLIALAILLLQVYTGAIHAQDFRLNAISTFWPYIAAIGMYLAYAAIRAPLILDRERADKIESQQKEITTLKAVASAPRFQTTLKNLAVSYRANELTTFHATVEIRNISGERSTLHDLKLACVRGATTELTNPDRRYWIATNDALETGTAREGNLLSVAPNRLELQQVEALKGTRWQFSFKDVRGQQYASNPCELK